MANGGGQNVSCDFGEGKRTIERPLQNHFWRPEKVGLVWSVPNCQFLVARTIRNAIRANQFARIIRNWNPYFYSVSGRFARITRISDSRESPDSRESCKSIRANHATKCQLTLSWAMIEKSKLFVACPFCPNMESVTSWQKLLCNFQACSRLANITSRDAEYTCSKGTSRHVAW